MKFAKYLASLLAVIALLLSILTIPTAAAAVTASPTQSPIFINGSEQKFEAFVVGGNNFFKIRDIAYALNGSQRQFQVQFNDLTKQIELTSHTAYTISGNEMAVGGAAGTVSAIPTPFDVYLDGVKISLTAYLIGSSNYVKLRDLAAALDFGVTYVEATKTIEVDTSKGYVADKPAGTFPSDLNVTLIGDSIGKDVTPYLKKYYPNLYADAEVSRQFSEAKGIVKTLLQNNKLGPVVVIELGANGTVSESQMRALIELIGSSRKIVFVNVQVPRSWCEGDNKTISKVVLDYTNAIIADWYSASINNSGYFYKDGVHPNNTGSQVLAKLISDAITSIQMM